MKIALIYSSTEGQTRKIARFAFNKFVELGHSAALTEAEEAEGIDLSAFDAVLMAGSVHTGQYQKELTVCAKAHIAALNASPTLFLSVSLAAEGREPNDMRELENIVARFAQETGWSPGRVEHVAGAFRFTEYDFFKYWAMRWIESKKDQEVEPGTDREYTDWAALEVILDDWTKQISSVSEVA